MTGKRIAILLLVLFLVVMIPVVWFNGGGSGTWRVQASLGGGAVIGLWFLLAGSLPDWIHAPHKYVPMGEMLRNLGALRGVNRDDDSDNLPLKVWGPILLGVILLAGGALAVFLVYF